MPKRLNEIKRSNRSSRSIASLRSSRFTAVSVGRVRARVDFTVTIHGHDHGLSAPRLEDFLRTLKSHASAKAKWIASSLVRAPEAGAEFEISLPLAVCVGPFRRYRTWP